MSDTTATDPGDLERRFRELVTDLAALGELLRGPSPFAIPATGLIPNVLDGQIIESAWGNAIRDRSLQKFDSLAALKAGWTSPPDGSHAYLLDENSLLVAKAGTWRWLQKSYPLVAGAVPYLTWGAGVTAAGSSSSLVISGRACLFSISGALATSATSGNLSVAILGTPYCPTAQIVFPMITVHSGAGSGRLTVATSGGLSAVFVAGDTVAAASSVSSVFTTVPADLVVA